MGVLDKGRKIRIVEHPDGKFAEIPVTSDVNGFDIVEQEEPDLYPRFAKLTRYQEFCRKESTSPLSEYDISLVMTILRWLIKDLINNALVTAGCEKDSRECINKKNGNTSRFYLPETDRKY